MTYYVRATTRGSPNTGSPRQAMNYITYRHDARRDSSYSDAELHYIARMDTGWKTDLEGGRVPLVGFGQLANELDQEKLAQRLEDSCLPYHSLCPLPIRILSSHLVGSGRGYPVAAQFQRHGAPVPPRLRLQ